MSSVNPNAYCSNCHDLGHLAANCTKKPKASPPAIQKPDKSIPAPGDVNLPDIECEESIPGPVQCDAGTKELLARIQVLEKVVAELCGFRKKRSEYMKDYMRRRRSSGS